MKLYNCKFNEKGAEADDLLAAIAWEMRTNKDGSVTLSKTVLARIQRHITKRVDRKDRRRQFEFEAKLRKYFKGKKITRSKPSSHPISYFADGKMIAIWEFIGTKEEYHRGWIIQDIRKGDRIIPRDNRWCWYVTEHGSKVDGLTTWPSGHRMIILPHRYPQWRKTVSMIDVELDPRFHPKRSKQYA